MPFHLTDSTKIRQKTFCINLLTFNLRLIRLATASACRLSSIFGNAGIVFYTLPLIRISTGVVYRPMQLFIDVMTLCICDNCYAVLNMGIQPGLK